MLKCLTENIIGITDIDCDCFDNDSGVDISESLSGLYLTDYISLNDISLLKNCESQSVYDVLSKVRRVGLQNFRNNFQRSILKKFKESHSSFNYQNRQYKTSYQGGNHTPEIGFKGIEICGYNKLGFTFTIEKIVTYFLGTGTKTLYVYSDQDLTTPIYEIEVELIDGKVINDIGNITLNLWNECNTCDEAKYYIMYETDATDNKDNKCDCGCSGSKNYKKYAEMQGVYFTDKTAFQNGEQHIKRNNYCNGIELYGQFKCDYSAEFCYDSEIDYTCGIGNAYATAVLYESAKYLMEIANNEIKSIFNLEKGMYKIIDQRLVDSYSYLYDMMKDQSYNCLTCRGSVRHT